MMEIEKKKKKSFHFHPIRIVLHSPKRILTNSAILTKVLNCAYKLNWTKVCKMKNNYSPSMIPLMANFPSNQNENEAIIFRFRLIRVYYSLSTKWVFFFFNVFVNNFVQWMAALRNSLLLLHWWFKFINRISTVRTNVKR